MREKKRSTGLILLLLVALSLSSSGLTAEDKTSKAGATFDQNLLVRKDQATTYSYGFNIGLSFTFGSMFSNVVNPRFE